MTRRPFDDNGAGVISYRAWLYGGSESGERLRASESERYEKTAATESRDTSPLLGQPRVFAPDPADAPDLRGELARLTDNERRAWELQQVGEDLEMIRIVGVPVGEEVAMNRRGFTIIEGTKRIDERGTVVYDFEGREYSTRGLSYSGIAERMGATLRQVKRWLAEARRKLRGER